ncbi:hypothetical protein D3C79_801090 [compost metagenome]
MNDRYLNNNLYSKKILATFLLCSAFFINLFGQQTDKSLQVAAYVGIVHPIVSYSDKKFTTNFKDSYLVGMPTGINVRKEGHLGFSLEMVPYIKVQNGKSRMSNFLFHPGLLFPLRKGFTFIGRAAFETSGRYGLTPVISKVITHGQSGRLFIAVPLPIRFGNEQPMAIAAAFQFGFIF